MTFDDAFERVLGHEGTLSLDPDDRGNWTSGICGVGELRGSMMGISAMSYPDLDIRSLTVDACKAIYKRDFWDRVQGDTLPDGVAFQLFDFAVNSGPGTAIRKLQKVIGVADDGRWGPVSRTAMASTSESDAILGLIAERQDYMTRLSTWDKHGKGWIRRMSKNLRYAREDS